MASEHQISDITVDIGELARWIVVAGIVLTPLFSFGELISLLRGLRPSQTASTTPLFVKAGKDALMSCLIMLGVLRAARSGRTNQLIIPFVILFAYTVIAVLLSISNPAIALSGLRWILPVFLAFFLYDFVTDDLMCRIARVLAILLIIQILVQFAELFLMAHLYGAILFGLAARVPGFFRVPVSAAFFSIVVLYFSFFYERSKLLRRSMYFIVPASTVLTQSGTGIVTLAVVAAVLLLGIRRIGLILPVGVVVMGILFPLLPVITGRGADYVAISGGSRVDIFLDLFRHSKFLPEGFGYSTNSAVLLLGAGGQSMSSDAGPAIVDSTYSSIIGNLGIGGAAFFSLFLLSWSIVVVCVRRLDLYVATVIFLLFGFTGIIFELYPMNLLFAVIVSYFLKRAYLPLWSMLPISPRYILGQVPGTFDRPRGRIFTVKTG